MAGDLATTHRTKAKWTSNPSYMHAKLQIKFGIAIAFPMLFSKLSERLLKKLLRSKTQKTDKRFGNMEKYLYFCVTKAIIWRNFCTIHGSTGYCHWARCEPPTDKRLR